MVFSCPYNSMLDTTVMDRRFTATTNKQSDANLSNSKQKIIFLEIMQERFMLQFKVRPGNLRIF